MINGLRSAGSTNIVKWTEFFSPKYLMLGLPRKVTFTDAVNSGLLVGFGDGQTVPFDER
jgi:hypothetical protein